MELREGRFALLLGVVGLALAACGDEDTEQAAAANPGSGNRPPVISGEPRVSVLEGEDYEFVPTASDPDGDPLIFNVSGKPGWMDFDSQTGRLSGQPRGNNVGMHRGIVVSVSDGEDEAILDPIDVNVLPASSVDNEAPTISGEPASSVTVGSFYDFVPQVADAEGDPLSFQIVSRPSWASFDATIGRLSGTPQSSHVGVYAGVVIRVSDGISTTELGPFVISVNPPPAQNTPPMISGVADPDVLVGQTWTFVPQADDADGDSLSFEVFNAPSWTSFDTTTGELSGTPGSGDDGSHGGITIVVSDGQATASLPAFSVEVIDPNAAPVISGNPPGSVGIGQAYSFTPTADDADGDALSFSISNRPAWASFDNATGSLSGTPGTQHVGTSPDIRITVSDGNNTDTLGPFSIVVSAANGAPEISGTAPGTALIGQAYSFTPTADDPDDDALDFSVTGLPVWAAFDSATGRISGTPGAGNVGVYSNISITVSDGEFSATLAAFSINVVGIATGSATLSWTPPNENTDGSPLTDLDGYVVYWGTQSGNYANSMALDDPGITTYIVDNLLSGSTYYFATTAVNSDGLESTFSNEASKTIP